MKKILALGLLALTTMFYSCSSDSDGGSSALTGSLKAKVDGQQWSSNLAVAAILDGGFEEGEMALQVVGGASDDSQFTMTVPLNNLTVGTHTYTGFTADGSLDYVSAAGDMFSSAEDLGTFTVNITEIDLDGGKISGTFSAHVVNFLDETQTKEITEGKFTDLLLISQSFYPGGTMSLSRNGGAAFTMDANQEDGKYLLLSESNLDNNVNLLGYNSTLTNDFGIYIVSFPLDVTPGTYSLTDDAGFKAGLASQNGQPEYTVTDGTVTITSHNNKNVVGTFSFTADNGASTVNITSGAFNVTHK